MKEQYIILKGKLCFLNYEDVALRNTQSKEVILTRCQTVDNQKLFSATNLKESGIYEDHE
jgi:hypothetical protein